MLIQYDANNVPIKVIKNVQKKYTEHKENKQWFQPEIALKISAAVRSMVQWVSGVVLYRTCLEQIGNPAEESGQIEEGSPYTN